ncbi:hypothetical protein HED60_20720 [Planctomycetales bacterium ZRK34]|nr:hypothetical protein HED60_20720 [Planctomycetales bacterium ZRK34]
MRRPLLPTLAFIATSLCLIPVTGALYVVIDHVQAEMLPHPFESSVTLRPASGAYRSLTLHATGEIPPEKLTAEACRLTLALTQPSGVVSVLEIDVTSNAHSIGRVLNLPTESPRKDVFLPSVVNQWMQRQNIDTENAAPAAELKELILAMRYCGQGATAAPWPLALHEQRLCSLAYRPVYPYLNWAPPACAAVMFLATIATYIRRSHTMRTYDFGNDPTVPAGRIAF